MHFTFAAIPLFHVGHCDQPRPCVFKPERSLSFVRHHHHSHAASQGKPHAAHSPPQLCPGGFPSFTPRLLHFHPHCISYRSQSTYPSLEPAFRPLNVCSFLFPWLWPLTKNFESDSLLWFFSNLVEPYVTAVFVGQKQTNISMIQHKKLLSWVIQKPREPKAGMSPLGQHCSKAGHSSVHSVLALLFQRSNCFFILSLDA